MRAIIAAVALACLAAPAFAQTYANVRVATGDGVELATDVYLPSGSGPFPTLLRRTPYGRAIDAGLAAWCAGSGYALVSQDVRGRGQSSGQFDAFMHDATDGAATIAWIAAQSWSNGLVGTYSASAEGIVQLLALGEGPPALRCAHIGVATDDPALDFHSGGVWRTELTTAWLTGLQAPAVLAAWRSHEVLDSFWDPMRLDATERGRVSVPVLLYGGFYDIFASGTPRTFQALQTQAALAARGDQFLLLGPWTHGGVNQPQQGEVLYDSAATYQYADDFVAFFDWCLKGGPRPGWAPVRYYVGQLNDDGASAGGSWRNAASWPPFATATTLHIALDGRLGVGALPATAPVVQLPVDPAAPLATHGGNNLSIPAGPYDQTAVDVSIAVQVATTPAVSAEVEIVGAPIARIWAASATTDVDVVVRLEQVTPGGKAMLITDGALRGRFVQGRDAIRPLQPGVPVRFDVELGNVAFVLLPGHALRLAISGTSSPRYEPNPGSATPLAQDPLPVPTTLTLLSDQAHPSDLVLPIVRGTLPAAAATDGGAVGDGATADAVVSRDGAMVDRTAGFDAAFVDGDARDAATRDAATRDAATGDGTSNCPVCDRDPDVAADGCGCHGSVGSPALVGSALLAVALLVRRRRRCDRG